MRSGSFLNKSLIGTGCLGLFGMRNSAVVMSVLRVLKVSDLADRENPLAMG